MITEKMLIEQMNAALNESASAKNLPLVFNIVEDAGEWKQPTREGNSITTYINGIASLTSDTVVPMRGLKIRSKSMLVTVIFPLPDDAEDASVVEPYLSVITEFIGTAQTRIMSDAENNSFAMAYFGSDLTPEEMGIDNNIGFCIPYSFNMSYSFIENGVNSLSCRLTFEPLDGSVAAVEVPFMELAFSRVPILNSAVTSDTIGHVKNYYAGTAFQISVTVPATTDNLFSQSAMEYLLIGNIGHYKVTIYTPLGNRAYNMHFSKSNALLRQEENMGFTIDMIEAFGGGTLTQPAQ